jgi:hypothetical protein
MNSTSSSPTTSTQSDSTQSRRACDRCHHVRERCKWAGADADACARCLRLQHLCQTIRPLRRPGRRARLPSGNSLKLVRSLRREAAHSCAGKAPNVNTSPFAPSANDARDIESLVPTKVTGTLQCNRVGLTRPISICPEVDGLELHLVETMMHKRIRVDRFIIGPSFRQMHLQAFAKHLNASMLLVKDAFVACASLLEESPETRLSAWSQQFGLKKAALALASLRSVQVYDSDDSSTILMLGIAIVTFAMHSSGGKLSICRHILGLIKPFHDHDRFFLQRLDSDGLSALKCLVVTETFICLFLSQLPTIRTAIGHFDGMVDRFLGVSSPLLAHLYTICELASLAHECPEERRMCYDCADLQGRVDSIEEALELWKPVSVESLREAQFETEEVAVMRAQARVLQLAALLVVHRLKHPFGTADARAMSMSREILDELTSVFQETGRSPPAVDIPYLIACLEITDFAERQVALDNLNLIAGFSARSSAELKAYLSCFWPARDDHDDGSIYWNHVWNLMNKDIRNTWRTASAPRLSGGGQDFPHGPCIP